MTRSMKGQKSQDCKLMPVLYVRLSVAVQESTESEAGAVEISHKPLATMAALVIIDLIRVIRGDPKTDVHTLWRGAWRQLTFA